MRIFTTFIGWFCVLSFVSFFAILVAIVYFPVTWASIKIANIVAILYIVSFVLYACLYDDEDEDDDDDDIEVHYVSRYPWLNKRII